MEGAPSKLKIINDKYEALISNAIRKRDIDIYICDGKDEISDTLKSINNMDLCLKAKLSSEFEDYNRIVKNAYDRLDILSQEREAVLMEKPGNKELKEVIDHDMNLVLELIENTKVAIESLNKYSSSFKKIKEETYEKLKNIDVARTIKFDKLMREKGISIGGRDERLLGLEKFESKIDELKFLFELECKVSGLDK